MSARILSRALAASAAFAFAGLSAQAAQTDAQKKMDDVPHCAKPIGVLAINEPQNQWWRQYNLGSPEALIKVFVMRSNCFTLVDRGAGFQAAQQERALAAGGDLRVGSNIGQGQILAADYILVPDIVSQNANAGGANIGGILGGFIGGPVGGLVGGINIQKKTADVTLSITDVRSSQLLATIDGHADKTNVGFGAGAGIWGYGGFGAVGATGYNNTEIGQVITLAYIQAYTDLVGQLGGVVDNGGNANAPQQAVAMTKPANMYAEPSTTSAIVMPLDVGKKLYPTGAKNGLMWEVQDELGHKGWVSSLMFELAH
jgi:curli biogenesis system outer membrane secretion channel CsgG